MQISDINFKHSTKISKLNKFLSENYKISIDKNSSDETLRKLRDTALRLAAHLREEMDKGPKDADYVKNIMIAETIDLILAEKSAINEDIMGETSVFDTIISQFYPSVDFWWTRGVPLETCLDMAILQYRASEFVMEDEEVRGGLRQRWEEEHAGMAPDHSRADDVIHSGDMDIDHVGIDAGVDLDHTGVEMQPEIDADIDMGVDLDHDGIEPGIDIDHMDIDGELEEADLDPIEFGDERVRFNPETRKYERYKETPPTLTHKQMVPPGKRIQEPPTVVPVSTPAKPTGKAVFNIDDKGRETLIRNDDELDFTQYSGMVPNARVNFSKDARRGNFVASFYNGEFEESLRVRFTSNPLEIHSITRFDGTPAVDPELLEPESKRKLLADIKQSIITKAEEI